MDYFSMYIYIYIYIYMDVRTHIMVFYCPDHRLLPDSVFRLLFSSATCSAVPSAPCSDSLNHKITLSH